MSAITAILSASVVGFAFPMSAMSRDYGDAGDLF